MDFFAVIEARRSVRRYKDTDVPEAVMRKALNAALLAPNSSNMQLWDFYWVRSPEKKAALQVACLSQPAAATAKELVVAVARRDKWQKNRLQMLEMIRGKEGMPKRAIDYYRIVIPLAYLQGWFSCIGVLKKFPIWVTGLFRPVPRGPTSNSELFEALVKTTALACENFMLAITAQGFSTCPMEGFDEVRVKRILGLNRHCRVVMCISVGEQDERGIFGQRLRFAPEQSLHEV